MKKILSALIVLAFTLALFGCSEEQVQQTDTPISLQVSPGAFVFTKENYPKMGGSLANLPLGEAVTATVLGIDRETASSMITFEGSTTDNYEALVDGTFDILLAYEMGEDAKAYCDEKGVELEMTAIGTDALVFICSLENEVQGLTQAQIGEIYKGNITNWKEVGGSDHAIIPYQRNKDSGSQTLFDKLVNLGDELMEAPKDIQIGSMLGLLEAVADYENSADALGYTVYYYLTNMEGDKLDTSKLLAVDGIAPTNETIASGEYPYVNDFYVVIRKDAPADSPERILYNWIISEQGKELARRENYVVKYESCVIEDTQNIKSLSSKIETPIVVSEDLIDKAYELACGTGNRKLIKYPYTVRRIDKNDENTLEIVFQADEEELLNVGVCYTREDSDAEWSLLPGIPITIYEPGRWNHEQNITVTEQYRDVFRCDDVYRTDDTPTHGSGTLSLPLGDYKLSDCKLLLCDDGCSATEVVNCAAQGYARAYKVVKYDEFNGNYFTQRFAMEVPEEMIADLQSSGSYEDTLAQIERDYYYLLTLDDTHYAYIRIEPNEDTVKPENEAAIVDEIIQNAVIEFYPNTVKE